MFREVTEEPILRGFRRGLGMMPRPGILWLFSSLVRDLQRERFRVLCGIAFLVPRAVRAGVMFVRVLWREKDEMWKKERRKANIASDRLNS